jgi:actin-related protein
MASEIFTRSLFKSKRTPPKPVVLDLGSHSVKAGFAYEKAFHPTRTFINCISSDVHNKVGKDCTCCSLSLTHSHSINDWPYCQVPTDQQRPIVRGRVRDYGVLESVIQHAIQCELQAFAPDSKLILTGHGLEECSDQLLEICFEKFKIPKLAIVPNSVLALYGTGRTDGIIVDVGHGVSAIDACLNGQIFQPASQFVKLAGKDLTDSLKDLIVKSNSEDGYGQKIMKEFGNIHMWTSTKEKYGKIAMHKGGGQALWDARHKIVNRRLSLVYSAKESAPMIRQMPAIDCKSLFHYLFAYDCKLPSGTEEYPMKLPDGTKLIVRSELTNFSEILFTGSKMKNLAPGSKRMHVSPGRRYSGSIIGDYGKFPGENKVARSPREEGTLWSPRRANLYQNESDYTRIPPLQELFWKAILNTRLSNENRAKLQHNVVLCGGTTLLPCFLERFRNEITSSYGWGSVGAKVYAPIGRHHLAWTGGNVLASSSFVNSSLMTTKDEYFESGSKVVEDRLSSFYSMKGGIVTEY